MRAGTPGRCGGRAGWRLRRWVVTGLLAAVSAALAANPPDRAAAERPSPDEIEAAYLYNFGKFVHWPAASAQQALTICVAGDDAMSGIAERLTQGQTIGGRPLAVRRMARPAGLPGCSILFIPAGEHSQQGQYLAGVLGKPVLTVGDGPDFLASGGVIQFVLTGGHVRFAINLNAAKRSGLQLSSELLKVAVSVVGQPGGAE